MLRLMRIRTKIGIENDEPDDHIMPDGDIRAFMMMSDSDDEVAIMIIRKMIERLNRVADEKPGILGAGPRAYAVRLDGIANRLAALKEAA